MYMASLYLPRAYYSVPTAEEQQEYFRFMFENDIFQYKALLNCLAPCHRLFTKVMIPVYSRLRSLGYLNSGFLDDSLSCGKQ